MDQDALATLQAPLKASYREDPEAAVVTLRARGRLGEGVSCSLDTGRALAEAGLHPAAGGDGSQLCSGDMLLEALVACAGVTLSRGGDLDGADAARRAGFGPRATSTSGGRSRVSKDAPVGFREIRLAFDVDTDATDERAGRAGQAHRAVLRRVAVACGSRPRGRCR